MTAIVNNARFSSNRGQNFQCSFLSFLYFTPSQCEWQLLPPHEWELWTFSFFFFSLSSSGDPEAECGLWLKHTIMGGSFWKRRPSLEKKEGQESKWEWHLPSAEAPLHASHWCAFSQSEPARGGDLHCKLAAHWPPPYFFFFFFFTSGQAGSHTHPIHQPSPE